MKRFSILGSLLGCLLLSQVSTAQTGMIQLSKPSDIKDANQVEHAIDRISKKVMSCVQNKLAEPANCHCLYPEESNNLKHVYDKVLSIHPDWKDKVVSYSDSQHSYGHNISFSGLGTQLKQKCK